MRTYTEGNIRKKMKRNGSWEWFGQVSYMEGGRQKHVGHYTGVACDPPTEEERGKRKRGDRPTGTGAARALREFRAWRDSLVEEEREREEQEALEQSRPFAATLTIAEYTSEYIERGRRVDGRELSESTKLDYSTVSRYFSRGERPISEIQVCDLRPTDVRSWEEALIDEGLSSVTVGKCHRLLHLVCQDAQNMRVIDHNPCAGVRPSKSKKDDNKKPNGLSDNDMQRAALILSTLMQTPKIVAAQLALYAGLRQGEVCGLQWCDVDLVGVEWEPDPLYRRVVIEGPKMRIRQSIGRSSGGCYPKEPKTRNGYRIIPICGHLLDALRAHRKSMWSEYEGICKAMKNETSEEEFSKLYVVGSIGGGFYNPTVLSRQWATTSKDLGLIGSDGRPVGFHDLRRSFPTIAQNKGQSVSAYKYVLGHSSGDLTTDVYTIPLSQGVQKATEVVAGELDRALAKPEHDPVAGGLSQA